MTDWLDEIFNVQKDLQSKIQNKTNLEDVVMMYNSATGALVEIGEMLQCDTRWKKYTTKSKKEPYVDKSEFLEEWSDVLIYMLNVLIYGGHDISTIKQIVKYKQNLNKERFGVK